MEVCIVRIILEKLALSQNRECCNADFCLEVFFSVQHFKKCCTESISMKVSDLIIYINNIM